MKNKKELLINEKTQKDTRIKAIKELLGTNKKYLENLTLRFGFIIY